MIFLHIQIRQFLFKTKKRFHLWFKFGAHYHRKLIFDSYVSKITKSCKEDKTDFQLLSEFSIFCKRKQFIGEAIELLEKLKETVREKTILNYFLLQNYIRHSNKFLLQHKDAAFIKSKAVTLIEETLVTEFGHDYMNQIKSNLSQNVNSVRSKVMVMDVGWENFGFIEHRDKSENKRFLTKIGFSLQENNEVKFYSLAPEVYPQIKEVIPAVTDIRISDGSLISLLTMETAPGTASNKQQINSLIDLHINYVQKCKYNPDKSLPFNGKLKTGYFQLFISKSFHLFLRKSFCRIHEKKKFFKLKKRISQALLHAAYDPKIKQAVKALGQQLEEIKLYELVSPEKHYSLCHGDYYLSNVLYDQKTEKFTIIDWTQCMYGPKLLDIAALLRNQRECTCSYKEIEELVLERIEGSAMYDEIDKLLFLYASIIISLLLERANIIGEDPEYFFLPTVAKCEELIASIIVSNPDRRTNGRFSKGNLFSPML